jgi:hypothetical protein
VLGLGLVVDKLNGPHPPLYTLDNVNTRLNIMPYKLHHQIFLTSYFGFVNGGTLVECLGIIRPRPACRNLTINIERSASASNTLDDATPSSPDIFLVCRQVVTLYLYTCGVLCLCLQSQVRLRHR